MTKRVLYFIGYPHRMAGSQKQIEQLILNLPSNYSPTLLLTLDSGVSKHFIKRGIKVKVLEPKGDLNRYGKAILNKNIFQKTWMFLTSYISYTKILLKYLKQEKFDLIHCNDARAVLLIDLARRLSGTKMVSHIQGERPMKKGLLWRLFEQAPLKIIANANFVKSTLSKNVWRKTSVVYTGLEDLEFISKPTSNWLNHQKESRLIISVFASVVPFKGHHHLIDAIGYLNQEKDNNDFLVLIVGDIVSEYKFYFNWLCKKISELNIGDKVMFLGWQDEPLQYYSISDFTVLPSFKKEYLNIGERVLEISGNEGFPTTHLEAMQFGLPIIGTSIAGVPEQIEHERNGIIVPPSDSIKLAKALRTLINDSNLRTSYGKESKKIVNSKFSLETFVKNVTEIYEEVNA